MVTLSGALTSVLRSLSLRQLCCACDCDCTAGAMNGGAVAHSKWLPNPRQGAVMVVPSVRLQRCSPFSE